MKKGSWSAPVLGGSSLLAVFGVLSLTVFALLSLTTVTARQRLSDSALASVTAYYQADTQAEEIFASLRGGALPREVEREGNLYRYQCPITESRTLYVELEKTGNTWIILRWQEVVQPQEIDDTLPVWDGK